MKLVNTKIEGLKIIKSEIFKDKRGFLREFYRKNIINNQEFPFDMVSMSKKNVLRGLHMQTKNMQGKYISVLKGRVLDIAVDLRKNSNTFGKYFAIELSEKNSTSIYIPEGFAHGFYCLDRENYLLYSCTNYRDEKSETGLMWNDKDLNIKWKCKKPLISDKDKNNISFKYFKNKFH